MITIKITEVDKIEIASIIMRSFEFHELVHSSTREEIELYLVRTSLELVERVMNGGSDGGMGLQVFWRRDTAGKDDGNMTMVVDRKGEEVG